MCLSWIHYTFTSVYLSACLGLGVRYAYSSLVKGPLYFVLDRRVWYPWPQWQWLQQGDSDAAQPENPSWLNLGLDPATYTLDPHLLAKRKAGKQPLVCTRISQTVTWSTIKLPPLPPLSRKNLTEKSSEVMGDLSQVGGAVESGHHTVSCFGKTLWIYRGDNSF